MIDHFLLRPLLVSLWYCGLLVERMPTDLPILLQSLARSPRIAYTVAALPTLGSEGSGPNQMGLHDWQDNLRR